MNDFQIDNELLTAVKAARVAGTYLKENKKNINKALSSTEKDIKLKADIEAENIIKEVLKNDSDIAILAEETGVSVECLPEVFWVVDPLVSLNFEKSNGQLIESNSYNLSPEILIHTHWSLTFVTAP